MFRRFLEWTAVRRFQDVLICKRGEKHAVGLKGCCAAAGSCAAGENPFVRGEYPLGTDSGIRSYGKVTRSYGVGNSFVRGEQPVRTGSGTGPYGGENQFVRTKYPLRMGGGYYSYGKVTPFVRRGHPVYTGKGSCSEKL